MESKKTANIDDMIVMVNKRNKESTCSADLRRGGNDLLEAILVDNGRYRGFGYYTQREVPEGQLPGIVRDNGETRFPDETRRFYYTK